MILWRAINWDLIRQQYDQMVKYATALRLGTAETEAILRRFTRTGLLLELSKAVKTIFLCRYLSSEALRREIHEGQSADRELEWGHSVHFLRTRGRFPEK